MTQDLSRRTLLATAAGAALAASLPRVAQAGPRLVLNDASRLSPTPVARHWIAGGEPEAEFLDALRRELREAARERRPFAVGGARHSMGGQSLARDGTAFTYKSQACEVDRAARTCLVRAGTRWDHVIATLDKAGLSPAVMQSNNDFAAGGTLSVNAHGWPAPFGPFGSTVRSFRLMRHDGTVVTCSPAENPDLFGLVQGGYGLFGVVLDMVLSVEPNTMLRPTRERMPAAAFGERFIRAVEAGKGVRMAYGRLSVARKGFFDEALLVTYRPTGSGAPLPPATSGGLMSAVSRKVFRAQVRSEAGKRARWLAEAVGDGAVSSGEATRNTLMNEPVANLAGADRGRTDILHEYFVPPERFPEFLQACRDTIPKSRQDLLNVTLRYVAADRTSVLAYAPQTRIAAVMLFSQAITPEMESDMLQMTEALVERVLAVGGSFYLPYRLHARPDQVARAYPRLPEFIAAKRAHDPGLLFRNAMWDAYFAPVA